MTESAPLWVTIVKVLAAFMFFLNGTAVLIWGERRLVARMQDRVGPNRAGPAGALQTVFDGVKILFKEDVTPNMVDKWPYLAAPVISATVAFMAVAVIPLSGEITLFGETFVLQVADLNVGLLWFLAMGSINVYGIVLAGWASQSPYPLLGGVRSSAQMISYEIAQGLAVASVFVYAGSLRVSDIVAIQANEPGLITGMPNWFVIPLFPAFLLFFISMVAETQRPPFDLPEAEGELVGGFHTEYSGFRFGLFFLAEFMNVITVSAIAVTMFFGGPAGPVFGPDWISWVFPILWFLIKTFLLVYVFILLRAALPRMRYDMLMNIGWKWLLPLGLIWVLATGFMVVVNEQATSQARIQIAIAGIIVAAILYLVAPLFSKNPEEESAVPPEPAPDLEEVGA